LVAAVVTAAAAVGLTVLRDQPTPSTTTAAAAVGSAGVITTGTGPDLNPDPDDGGVGMVETAPASTPATASDDSVMEATPTTASPAGASLAPTRLGGEGAESPDDTTATDANEDGEDGARSVLSSTGYPITTNTSEDYPLEAFVELAVGVVRAEVTGENRDAYPHLVGAEPACCTDFEVRGAMVLFAALPGAPTQIHLGWQATDAEGRVEMDLTLTLWRYDADTAHWNLQVPSS
jgi:hypothetical protein